jgi:hypothetical protein
MAARLGNVAFDCDDALKGEGLGSRPASGSSDDMGEDPGCLTSRGPIAAKRLSLTDREYALRVANRQGAGIEDGKSVRPSALRLRCRAGNPAGPHLLALVRPRFSRSRPA